MAVRDDGLASATAGRWLATLANFALFQVGWFACVLGAAQGRGTLGAVLAALIVVVHLAFVDDRRHETGLVAISILVGLLCDGALRASGLVVYRDAPAIAALAPAWILALWALLAIALGHSMRWLQRRPAVASVFGAVGGPLSYLAGERLGAIVLPWPPAALAALAAVWAVVMPGLLRWSARPAARGAER